MKHNKILLALALIAIALFTTLAPMPAEPTAQPQSLNAVSQQANDPSAAIAPGVPLVDCVATVLPNDNSSSGNARAPSTKFASSRAVYLIKATELAANGYASGQMPTSLGWTYFTGPGVSGAAPLKIYLQNTADTTYTKGTSFSTAITGMTLVHNATTTLPGTVGPFDIPLMGGSPFTYTGGGLYVAYDWGVYSGTLSTADQIIFCNSTGLQPGLAGVNSNSNALGLSNFRPETRLSSSTQNDAAVAAVYSYGELPLGFVPAQVIKGVVDNLGGAAQTNLPVTLNVTGAQTFTNMQTIASLAACTGEGTATFASFTPSAAGSDTVTVSVPADDVNANNSLSHPLSVTANSYSYKYPGTTSAGGAGFTNATGTVVGKFTVSSATMVTDVKLEFFGVSATTYRVAIYPDSGSGTPGTTALYVDAADRTVSAAGTVTITLPSPVAVGPGNFFVGMQQTNTTNSNLAFDNESPIRPGSFYAGAVPPTAWTDFSPATSFKLNIGLLLPLPATTVTGAVSRKTHGAAGAFDIPLPLTGTTGVEDRAGGATNDYTMVVTFAGNITVSGSPQAQVTSGTATIGSNGVSNGGAVTVAANVVTIPLTNVADQQTINVTLNGVNSASDQPTVNVVIPMSRLLGDSNGNRSVNAGDVSQVKQRIGQAVSAANFRSDFNANGSINAGDVSIAKQNTGHGVP